MNGLKNLKWYWITRALGAVVFLNEVFIDVAAKDRATIALAAAALMGVDKVVRVKNNGKNNGA